MSESKAKLRGYQFRLHGKRQTVSFGRCSRAHANEAKSRIRDVLAAKRLGSPLQSSTVEWLAKIDDKLYGKLASLGLVPLRFTDAGPQAAVSVRSYVDGFLARYGEKVKAGERKERTLWTMKNDADCLYRFLADKLGKPSLRLAEFTADDADAFRTWMLAEKYAVATASRRIIRAREFFKAAIRSKQIVENPFAETETGQQENKGREREVTREQVQRLIDVAPNAEWRLLIALSRFGGLRMASEAVALNWGHVDFDNGRITIPAVKTKERVIPMFPELREYLEDAYELAKGADGLGVVKASDPVIRSYRDKHVNLRTPLLRLMVKAGMMNNLGDEQPWPRLWHNMRGSRQNELADTFPEHVVNAWIGNSKAVARKHYLGVRDSHFAAALAQPKRAAKSLPSDASTLHHAPSDTVNGSASEFPQVAEVAVFAEKNRHFRELESYPRQGTNISKGIAENAKNPASAANSAADGAGIDALAAAIAGLTDAERAALLAKLAGK